MKSASLLFIAILFLQFVSFAQAPDTIWTKTFGGPGVDFGYSVEQTSDGGYIITGSAEFTTTSYDIGLLKTDSNGSLQWFKTFGGSNIDVGRSVIQTMDGGYIVSGYTVSFGAGLGDVWLIKTDSNGNEQWNKTYGGISEEGGECIKQLSNGGYIIAGYTSSYGAGGLDLLLLKVDANGNPFWQKTFGGTGNEAGYSIDVTSDGSYVITGRQSSTNPNNNDVSLLKADSNGNILWLKNYGGIYDDIGRSVKQTSDGGYIITGFTRSFGSGQEDVWLIKTDSLGNEQWSKTFGGDEGDIGYSVDQTSDGGYIVVGLQESISFGGQDIGLLKTDSNGNLIWFKNIGGISDDQGFFVKQTSDGGYIIAGATLSYGMGSFDVYLVKIKPEVTIVVNNKIINDYRLSQNFPNPFNPSTKIEYSIPQSSQVQIKVFDVLGNEIETLVNQEKPAGTYEITWYAEGLPSGVYFYQLRAVGFVQTKKMIMLK